MIIVCVKIILSDIGYIETCGHSSVVEYNLAKVGVVGSSPITRSIFFKHKVNIMAKKSPVITIKMVSSANTGYFYVTKKNPKNLTEKLELIKYDPKVRKRVLFKEHKIK